MPVKSARQFRLMQAAAHSKKGIGGLSLKDAKEMLRKTSKKKRKFFAKEKK